MKISNDYTAVVVIYLEEHCDEETKVVIADDLKRLTLCEKIRVGHSDVADSSVIEVL